LKTKREKGKALGLGMPSPFLARADDVIE